MSESERHPSSTIDFVPGDLATILEFPPQAPKPEMPVSALRRHVRGSRPANLSEEGWRWFCMFPGDERPISLASRYPHLVNELARLWESADLHAYDTYLKMLVISDRSDRQGFPPVVLSELIQLQSKV